MNFVDAPNDPVADTRARLELLDEWAANQDSMGFDYLVDEIRRLHAQIDRLTRVCRLLVAGDRLAALKVMEEL